MRLLNFEGGSEMMKKGFQFMTIVFGLLAFTSLSWGATLGTGSVTVGNGANSTTFQTSPRVYLDYTADATGSTYVAASVNSQGTRAYGVDADFTGVYVQTVSSGQVATTLPTPSAGTTGEFGSGWSTLGN